MKKIALIFAFCLSFVNSFAVQCNYTGGCFDVLPDGSVYVKIGFSGTSSCPDFYLYMDNAGSVVGPFSPDYVINPGSNTRTLYYFLPPGTLTTPIPDCINIGVNIQPTLPTIDYQVCRCPESEECDASFSFTQYSNMPGTADITPTGSNILDFAQDYGTGGSPIFGAPYSNIYSSPGTYTVCLIVINTNGDVCKDCMDICITEVESGGNYKQSGNNGSDNSSKSIKTTGLPISNLKLYPNPSNGVSNLNFASASDVPLTINLYDLSGKLIRNIHSGAVHKGQHTYQINTKSMAPGVYIIGLSSGDKELKLKLVIIN